MIFGDTQSKRMQSDGLVAVLRVLDVDDLERQVTLVEREGESVAFRSVAIIGEPLARQLAEAHANDPGIEPTSACDAVRRVANAGDSSELIEHALEGLKALRIPPVLPAPFAPHGRHYEVRLYLGASQSYFEFAGLPEGSANPLQEWCDQVLRLVPVEHGHEEEGRASASGGS